MQADVRGAIGKRCVDHGPGNLTGLRCRHSAAGTEWSEVDLVAECLGGFDGGNDMTTWFALDERFDGELEQQHATEL